MFKEIKNYFANFSDVTNTCRTIALWVTIALLVAFVVTRLYILVARKKQKYDEATLAAVSKIANGAWIVIALTAAVCYIITFAACYFVGVAHEEESLFPILFYPLLVLALAVVASAITLFVKPNFIAKIVCAAVCGSALIAVIVCMIVYYQSGQAAENNWMDVLSNIGLYLSAVILAAAIIVAAILCDRKSKPMDTRTITYAAVCVALSFALSYIRLFKMPMGGSITFASMLPLMLFAFMFGSRKGVIVGVIYGLLQAIQDPWIIHPAQFALDYLVAFGAIGLTGCIRELGAFKGNMRAQFALGAVVACALRFISHYFAGVFAFGAAGADYVQYGSAFANAYFYSFVYQCLYIIPELAIVMVASMLVLTSSAFRKQIEIRIAAGAKGEKQAATPMQESLPETEQQLEPTVSEIGDKAE
ncbi:MAG: energy-coupled thiamine transporter ThiT [Clostridiales bacterium]|nr:energy-coupled thiamine transporter ThiT [Clostridiales bacterium]